MNPFRWIFPLGLRQRLAYPLVARTRTFPLGCTGPQKLALAPVSLAHLSQTDVAHRCIAWMGFYELTLSRLIAKLATKPGGLLVDVGANAGYYSCMWASLLPRNRCLAFEASPRNWAMLRSNINSAGLQGQIEMYEFALGASDGTMDFDPGPAEQTDWGGLVIAHTDQCVKVEVKRLDRVIPPQLTIDVLKIDTEGGDTWVLEGAERLLRERRIHHVFFECNRARMNQLQIAPELPFQILRDNGYHICALNKESRAGEFHAQLD